MVLKIRGIEYLMLKDVKFFWDYDSVLISFSNIFYQDEMVFYM